MVKREIDCVYPNKKTGSSFTTGMGTAVTPDLWLIYSIRNHFAGMAESIGTVCVDLVSTWPASVDMH